MDADGIIGDVHRYFSHCSRCGAKIPGESRHYEGVPLCQACREESGGDRMDVEIKPCPFCGKQPKGGADGMAYSIRCIPCGVTLLDVTWKGTVEKWNRRSRNEMRNGWMFECWHPKVDQWTRIHILRELYWNVLARVISRHQIGGS